MKNKAPLCILYIRAHALYSMVDGSQWMVPLPCQRSENRSYKRAVS